MKYIVITALFVVLMFAFRVLSFRAKSINCSIHALKETINILPDESTPSEKVIKSELTRKYYELSHRVQNNDIRDYAKKVLSIKAPQPEHIAMLLFMGLSSDFLQQQSTKLKTHGDIARWCETAYDYLVTQGRNKYSGT
ncbi:hypothetical protein GAW91_000226 [Vibrio fluvialis]|nr:hypothetical protein [Vibrio fluvialis]